MESDENDISLKEIFEFLKARNLDLPPHLKRSLFEFYSSKAKEDKQKILPFRDFAAWELDKIAKSFAISSTINRHEIAYDLYATRLKNLYSPTIVGIQQIVSYMSCNGVLTLLSIDTGTKFSFLIDKNVFLYAFIDHKTLLSVTNYGLFQKYTIEMDQDFKPKVQEENLFDTRLNPINAFCFDAKTESFIIGYDNTNIGIYTMKGEKVDYYSIETKSDCNEFLMHPVMRDRNCILSIEKHPFRENKLIVNTFYFVIIVNISRPSEMWYYEKSSISSGGDINGLFCIKDALILTNLDDIVFLDLDDLNVLFKIPLPQKYSHRSDIFLVKEIVKKGRVSKFTFIKLLTAPFQNVRSTVIKVNVRKKTSKVVNFFGSDSTKLLLRRGKGIEWKNYKYPHILYYEHNGFWMHPVNKAKYDESLTVRPTKVAIGSLRSTNNNEMMDLSGQFKLYYHKHFLNSLQILDLNDDLGNIIMRYI